MPDSRDKPYRWWASLDGLKRMGLTNALDGVRLVPDGDMLNIHAPDDLLDWNEDMARIISWAAEWSRLGFPIVQMPHRFAAALMCTEVPPVQDALIRPPWPQFLVSVPTGMLSILGPDGSQLNVDRVSCVHHAGHWGICVFVSDTILSMPWRATAFLRNTEPADPATVFPEHQEALDAQSDRVLFCIGRLVLNLCLAFSDPSNVREVGKGHTGRRGQTAPRQPKETHRIFEVGRPVRVDCRDYVRSFVIGDRQRLAVRLLVRGFWRNQPHGPANSLRRRQWVEPYWKGDIGTPILTRPHDLRRPPVSGE